MKINEILLEYNTRQSLRSLRGGIQIDPIDHHIDDSNAPYSTNLHGINSVRQKSKKSIGTTRANSIDNQSYENSLEYANEVFNNPAKIIEFLKNFGEDVAAKSFVPFFFMNKSGLVAGKIKTKKWQKTLEILAKFDSQADILRYQKMRVHIKSSDADRDKLERALSVKSLQFTGTNSFLDVPLTNSTTFDQALDFFWTIASIIDDQPFARTERRSQSARSLIDRKNTPIRYYLAAATVLYAAYRFGVKELVSRGGRADSKSKGIYDLRDDLITIGATQEGIDLYKNGQSTYREHAVPCDAISREALNMYAEKLQGKPMGKDDFDAVMEVANMIKDNLCIVLCSKAEADKMNTEGTTNPMGWTPENRDILARFKYFKIPVYSLLGNDSRGSRLAEVKILS